VTQTDNAPVPTSTSTTSRAARLAWLLLIVATLYLCYFHNLGAIGLIGPDEPRYAWIARTMVESGDWITPRLYGQPWFEKPILYYWSAALSFKLFGVSETAARLPSAVAALLATLALAWLAWRIYGEQTARWLLLLLPTTVGMIGFSHAAATDMPFASMLTIAVVCVAVVVGLTRDSDTPILPRTPWLPLLLLGFFLGLAVLAKGPVAIVLSGGAVLFWAICTGRWRDAFRCLHPIATASFCVTALPWYILCAHRNPGFFRVFIIEHNLKRYLTPEFQHVQPFWFYVPVLLVGFLPWTLGVLWSAEFGFWRERRGFRLSAISIFLLAWTIFCILFFSLSQSKLPGYVLPAMPPAALLVARCCIHLAPLNARPFRWIRFGFYFLALPVSIAMLWIRRYGVSGVHAQKMTSAAYILFLLGLTNLLVANKVSANRFFRQTACLCVVPVLIILAAFGPLAAPWLSTDTSAKALAQAVSQLRPNLPSLSALFVRPENRNIKYGLSFYLHREIPSWEPNNPKPGILLFRAGATKLDCENKLPPGWNCSTPPIVFGSTGWTAYRVHTSNTP
jgi:4-amino-4-deoxy-L-arabinose transferase-like glycosyltransferase